MNTLKTTKTHCKTHLKPKTVNNNLFYNLYIETSEEIKNLEIDFFVNMDDCDLFTIEPVSENYSVNMDVDQLFEENFMIVKSVFNLTNLHFINEKTVIARLSFDNTAKDFFYYCRIS